MKWDNFPYLVVGYTAVVCAFAGFIGGNMFAQGEIDWMNWIGATDGWLAGFVGAVTIFAILRQIRSQSEDTHKQANEAKELFISDIEQLVLKLNRSWKIAEDLRQAHLREENVEEYTEWLRQKIFSFNDEIENLEIQDQLRDMLPLDRAKSNKIIKKVSEATSVMYEVKLGDGPQEIIRYEVEGEEYLEYLIICLAELRVMLNEFSPSLAAIFANRSQPPLLSEDTTWVHFLRSGMPYFPKNESNRL